MAYITASDIYDYKIYALSSTVIATATVSLFIEEAESVIDGKLAKTYTVPFSSTGIPPIIKKIDRDITAFYCLEYLYQQQNRNYSDYLKTRYSDAVELLQQICDTHIALLASLTTGGYGVLTEKVNTTLAGTKGTPPIANVDDYLSWGVPANLASSISSARASAGGVTDD